MRCWRQLGLSTTKSAYMRTKRRNMSERSMKYRLLGRTGLLVSELTLGTMTFGGKGFWEVVGKQGQDVANAIVARSLDAGINFIDTADVYSFGESETLLSKALEGRARDSYVLATKVRG